MNYYVTFKVKICDTEYSYQGNRGEAEVQIQVPRDLVFDLDSGNLFQVALKAAAANLNAAIVAKAEEEVAKEEAEK